MSTPPQGPTDLDPANPDDDDDDGDDDRPAIVRLHERLVADVLSEFPEDLRSLLRIEPLNGGALKEKLTCPNGHVWHFDPARNGVVCPPCDGNSSDETDLGSLIDLAEATEAWVIRSEFEGRPGWGVITIPFDWSDWVEVVVIMEESEWSIDLDGSIRKVALWVALDLADIGALHDCDEEGGEGFMKRADGTILLPWLTPPHS